MYQFGTHFCLKTFLIQITMPIWKSFCNLLDDNSIDSWSESISSSSFDMSWNSMDSSDKPKESSEISLKDSPEREARLMKLAKQRKNMVARYMLACQTSESNRTFNGIKFLSSWWMKNDQIDLLSFQNEYVYQTLLERVILSTVFMYIFFCTRFW